MSVSRPAPTGRRIVFDTTCLCHFARIDRIDVLGELMKDDACYLPDLVAAEIAIGAKERECLRVIPRLDWLVPFDFDTVARLNLLNEWVERLGAGTRDMGEAAVLAAAQEFGAVALIDDRVAKKVAEKAGAEVHGTLWLLACACKDGTITEAAASRTVDELSGEGMRLPCSGSDFSAYARKAGLL